MLSLNDKISCLEKYLIQNEENYADSFKTDIAIFLGNFEIQNSKLNFLSKLNSNQEIIDWVNTLTSKIVLKYDGENEQLSDFIFDYLEFG